MNNWWNDNDGETRVIWGRGGPLPANATLSTTNPMWTGLGLNLGLDGERPVIITAQPQCSTLSVLYTLLCLKNRLFVIAMECA